MYNGKARFLSGLSDSSFHKHNLILTYINYLFNKKIKKSKHRLEKTTELLERKSIYSAGGKNPP